MLSFFGNTAKSYLPNGDSPNAPVGTKVIIVAGQSNAGGEANNGSQLPSYLKEPLSGFFRKYKYNQTTNNDPFTIVDDTSATTIGPDVNLGYLYQKFNNENIYIIKHAFGATGLSQERSPNWHKDTSNSLFAGLKDSITTGLQSLIEAGLSPSIRGFVWFQGEEDGFEMQTKDQYKINEQNFFSQMKIDLGLPNFYIYSVLIKKNNGPSHLGFDNVRQAKAENEAIIPNYSLVNVDDLETNNVDHLHLTTASQIELGRRIFELLKFN